MSAPPSLDDPARKRKRKSEADNCNTISSDAEENLVDGSTMDYELVDNAPTGGILTESSNDGIEEVSTWVPLAFEVNEEVWEKSFNNPIPPREIEINFTNIHECQNASDECNTGPQSANSSSSVSSLHNIPAQLTLALPSNSPTDVSKLHHGSHSTLTDPAEGALTCSSSSSPAVLRAIGQLLPTGPQLRCSIPKTIQDHHVLEFCGAKGETRKITGPIEALIKKIHSSKPGYLQPKSLDSSDFALCSNCRQKFTHLYKSFQSGKCQSFDPSIQELLFSELSVPVSVSEPAACRSRASELEFPISKHVNAVINWIGQERQKTDLDSSVAELFQATINHLEKIKRLTQFQMQAAGEKKEEPSKRDDSTMRAQSASTNNSLLPLCDSKPDYESSFLTSDAIALQSAIDPTKVTVTSCGTQVVTIPRTEVCVHAQLKALGASDELASQSVPSLTKFPHKMSEEVELEINVAEGKLRYCRVPEEEPNSMIRLVAKLLEANAQLPKLQEAYTYHGTREIVDGGGFGRFFNKVIQKKKTVTYQETKHRARPLSPGESRVVFNGLVAALRQNQLFQQLTAPIKEVAENDGFSAQSSDGEVDQDEDESYGDDSSTGFNDDQEQATLIHELQLLDIKKIQADTPNFSGSVAR